jgi:hypothetical protein
MERGKSTRSLWWAALKERSVWSRGAKLGLTVGVIQAVVNQGDKWVTHSTDSVVVLKSIVSPLITFSVALVSAAATSVEKLKLK